MGATTPETWTTQREIEWLKGLGAYQMLGHGPGILRDQRTLLHKYLNSMHLRYKWGAIDPLEVECWIRRRLRS